MQVSWSRLDSASSPGLGEGPRWYIWGTFFKQTPSWWQVIIFRLLHSFPFCPDDPESQQQFQVFLLYTTVLRSPLLATGECLRPVYFLFVTKIIHLLSAHWCCPPIEIIWKDKVADYFRHKYFFTSFQIMWCISQDSLIVSKCTNNFSSHFKLYNRGYTKVVKIKCTLSVDRSNSSWPPPHYFIFLLTKINLSFRGYHTILPV